MPFEDAIIALDEVRLRVAQWKQIRRDAIVGAVADERRAVEQVKAMQRWVTDLRQDLVRLNLAIKNASPLLDQLEQQVTKDFQKIATGNLLLVKLAHEQLAAVNLVSQRLKHAMDDFTAAGVEFTKGKYSRSFEDMWQRTKLEREMIERHNYNIGSDLAHLAGRHR